MTTEETNNTELTTAATAECGDEACCQNDQPTRTGQAVTVRPAVDAWSNETDVYLVADVPGASADSVEVTIERDLLTFEAATKPIDENVRYREFTQRLYRRSFRLSDQIDREAVEANVTNGVLRLRLPKVAEATPLKVTVTAN